jgi:plastocyanin
MQFNDACSVPLGGAKKVTYFNCDEDLSGAGLGDVPVTFCVIAADAAIPDNPNGANQGANASQANLSARVCDSIQLDRTAPQVAITPSATTVYTGDLVQLDVAASDATSGLSGAYAWAYGDNTAAGAGEHTSHSFTQPGTYEVKVSTKDGAGNETTAAKVITVNARTTPDPKPSPSPSPSPGPSSSPAGSPSPGPSPAPSPSTGGGSTPTQVTTVAGLEVTAPRRVTAKTRSVAVALTADTPGKAALALVRSGKVHAQGTATIAAAGTVGYKLRLPRKLKAGAYQLKISFTPAGAATATTRTVKLTITSAAKKKKKKAAKASLARAASVTPRVSATGAPAGMPSGKAPAGTSRSVHLPLR